MLHEHHLHENVENNNFLEIRMFRTMRGKSLGLIVSTVFGVSASAGWAADLSGTVKVDGSSTVAPITMAGAEMFQEANPKVRVTVGISGTGGGFKKFLDEKTDLRTDINDASRPIKEAEMKRAKEIGVEFIEIPIAMDGLAVVVHPSNTFANHLTVEELKKIWEPKSTIKNWKDIRAGFPDVPLKLYGPGTDSGTFDYFTEVIVGKEKSSRNDYTASESDNVLVQGVSGDKGALGYFGQAYFEANKSKLKLLAIDNGNGKPVAPTTADIVRGGTYAPLSRPLFIYVNAESLKRREVRAFAEYLLDNSKKIVEHPRVGYVALNDDVLNLAKQRLKGGKAGSAMNNAGKGAGDLKAVFSAP
jgi:phosphate transport system substrate-binding protein